MEDPRAPLMAGNEDRADERESSDAGDNLPPRGSRKPADTNPGAFVVALTLAAGISGLLFGYDTGVISATLVSIGTALSNRSLTSMDKSVITSSTSLFALVASPLSSILADKLGRKHVILYADILFIAGALVQALASTVPVMVAGRCIVGAGVGAASFVVPLYLAEVAPAEHRGRVVTANVLFITLGQMVAYVVGWAFSTYAAEETGWRWMVGLGAAPAALQGVIVVFMPETPRWLVKVGRSAEARRVVERTASVGTAGVVIKEIEAEARQEDEAGRLAERRGQGSWQWLGAWRELLGEGKNRRALAIACLLQGLQQLCGFVCWPLTLAVLWCIAQLTASFAEFAHVLFGHHLYPGRVHEPDPHVPHGGCDQFHLHTRGAGPHRPDGPEMHAALLDPAPDNGAPARRRRLLISLAQSHVHGPSTERFETHGRRRPWMQSELFPLAVRSLGSGVATATNWTANFAVGLTFLPMMDTLSPSWTFVLYAAVCAVGYVLVWRIYPETAGLSLEEATALLERGWGVG